MDSPISWFFLIILVIYLTIRFIHQGEEERSRYDAENSKFFNQD